MPEKPVVAQVEYEDLGVKRNLRRRALASSGLIKTALTQQEDTEDIEVKKIAYGLGDQLREPINQEELDEMWRGFVTKLASRPALQSAMTKIPKVEGESTLVLEVGSKIAEEEISKIKPDLLGYLKKKLRNSYIELNTTVVELEDIEGRPLTDSEVFLDMKRKNPNLVKLISLLQLDVSN